MLPEINKNVIEFVPGGCAAADTQECGLRRRVVVSNKYRFLDHKANSARPAKVVRSLPD